MDKPSDAPRAMAPGAPSGAEAVRLPAAEEWPPVDEYLDEPEVTRWERVEGTRFWASPARREHALPHLRLDYLVGAHVREGYEGASDLKTRVSDDSEHASDTAILKQGIDPQTGRRYLEELIFEVVSEGSLGDINRRARSFARRGVRRQIAIFVKKGEVCEWVAAGETWRRLDPEQRIRDKCLARPLEVAALLDAAQADVAVALALEAKGNPAILEMKERSRAAGQAEALLAVLEARGFEVGSARRESILATADPEILSRWLRRASTASALEEVFAERS